MSVGPAVAALGGPPVEIGGMAAHVGHCVDGARPTNHLSAGAFYFAVVEMEFRLGEITPVMQPFEKYFPPPKRYLD